MSNNIDLYKVLGVDINASEAAIRQAYKRKALEWHPDKRGNDINAERMFKEIKKAYETLSNTSNKLAYDAQRDGDDDQDILSQDVFRLYSGKRLSEIYEQKITQWTNEYSSRKFVDNFENETIPIARTIADKYKQEINMKFGRIICSVCHEYCDDLNDHMESMQLEHKKYLQKICGAETLDNLLASLAPNDWSWLPIQSVSLTLRDLWFSTQWSSFHQFADAMSPSLEIMNSKSWNNTNIQKNVKLPEIESIVHTLSGNLPVINSPNIAEFIRVIDAELQTHTSGSEPSADTTLIGKEICIVGNPDRNRVLTELTFTVQTSPSSIKEPNCSSCSKSFGLFRRRYHCRMCGKSQCNGCQVWTTCRHIGYTVPVRVCHQCSVNRKLLLTNAIHSHVQQILNGKLNTQHLIIYIYTLKHYRSDNLSDDNLYQEASDYFLNQRQFTNAIQCFNCRSVKDNSWVALAETLCSYSAYQYASYCFNIVSERYRYELNRWKQLGDQYCSRGNAVLALLAYRQAKQRNEDTWLKSQQQQKFNDDDRALFALYTTFQKRSSNQLNEWKKWISEYLQDENLRKNAIFTLQLTCSSAQDWSIILIDLADRNYYISVSSIILALEKSLVTKIMRSEKCTNLFVKLVCQLVTGSMEDVETWIIRIIDHLNIKQIVFGLAVVHVFYHPNWRDIENRFVLAGQYEKALFCVKVRIILQETGHNSFEWIDTGLTINEPIIYLFKSLMVDRNYIELAESYAELKHSEIALNYYLLALDSSSSLSMVETLLTSATRLLSSPNALRCSIAVYKRMRNNSKCALKALEFIVNHFCGNKKPILSVLASIILTFENVDNKVFPVQVHFLKELSKQFNQNFDHINALFHVVSNLSILQSTLLETIQSLIQSYQMHLQTTAHSKIKEAVYKDIIELTICLRDTANIEALKQVRTECFGNRNMSTMPGEYRAKMYLVDSIIDKLDNRYINAVGKLNQVMALFPQEDTVNALVLLMTDPSFHYSLLQELISAIQTTVEFDSSLFTSYVSSPPTSFINENLLTPSSNLNFIRKYERAILKRLNSDPLQAAFSYIDMCQAIHDPTCIVSNWTLACLHFYELLLQLKATNGKEAQIYAYRNVINELSSTAFSFARIYLPPHMQIYIFQLLLPILIQTAQIFRSSINHTHPRVQQRGVIQELVITEREQQVITQLCNCTIHLAKVAPLIQFPTVLSHDILYYEVVGQRFLVAFLEKMIEEDIEQSHLYEYYLFEGIWEGWVHDRNFMDMRLTCMKALLDTKDWDLSDVQLLLDIPLIPRTNDGWLYCERQPLVFSGVQRFNRVDGITFDMNTGEVQFNFEPATSFRNQDDALFSVDDVTEIFKNGLPYAFFTLNQPSNDFHAHPFQEMLYSPSSLLYTQYLATLLHADYLLKMFTTGTEVCSKPPFDMRPIDQGFFKRLPEYLQEKLKPLHKCERNRSLGRAHRFWIEADEVVYEQQVTETRITCRVADVRLRVRKHLLIRDSEGRLVDDEAENESEEEKHSAESQFAEIFTKYYDEIGAYFPELLRLKELLKLSALYIFAQSHYERLTKPVDYNSIITHLTTKSIQLEYPKATNASVDTYYNKVLSENGVSSWDVPSDQASSLRSKIRTQLEEVDREILNTVTSNFCEQSHVNVSNVARNLVDAWLRAYTNSTKELAQFIADGLSAHHHQLSKPLAQLGIRRRDSFNEHIAMSKFKKLFNIFH